MGIDLAYFAAASDGEAADAGRRAGGPPGRPHVSGTRRLGLFRRRPTITELGPAVRRLRELARTAVADGHRLYCYDEL